MQRVNKHLSITEARQKIYPYCAYQERSHLEVKQKLYDLGLRKNEVDELLAQLITEGFLNEERFAKAYAGGKFRMKKWGRVKITNELEAKGLTPNCIQSGLKEITEEDYIATLLNLMDKKLREIQEENEFVKKNKVAKYLIAKGFEGELVWSYLKSA